MRSDRRRFLWIGGGATLGLTTVYGASRWYGGKPEDVVLAVLERRVGYLKVDRASFEGFAVDYVASRKRFIRELSLLAIVALPYRYVTPAPWLKRGNALRRLEDNVVSRYLLSTDFFHNGADETRPVAYVAFYDPYNSVCRNPFVPRPGAAA